MKRVKGKSIVIPVVTGSIAFWLGKKAEESKSHKWHVYLRSYNSIDLSFIIKHVEFILHESFEPRNRVIAEQPYEISEFGWGEFEIIIRVHFKDNTEKPVDLYHPLRLFPPPGQEISKKPVVSEFYEEILIRDPGESFIELYKSGSKKPAPTSQFDNLFTSFEGLEDKDMDAIIEARIKIWDETCKKRKKLEELVAEKEKLLREIESFAR